MPIATVNLTHTYMPNSPFQATAIHDVSLKIAAGECVGLIGHTGSGKSTLAQHLNGLLKPTSGTVLVDDMDLSAKTTDLRAVRRRVGLVFQYPEYQLFEETVEADIAFGPKNCQCTPQEVAERVREAAAMVGVGAEAMQKSPFELSGGQKRRVAIAGVLAMRPEILVLDEPAAGLDPRGREGMMRLMEKLRAESRITLVMVSHSMRDVARLCDRVLVMNRGELAMDGTPDEIFRRPQELEAMGLGLPPYAQLARLLREKGVAIPEDIWREDDVTAFLLDKLKGGACL